MTQIHAVSALKVVLWLSALAPGGWLVRAERPYITVGFSAFVILIPMAVTSTKGWIRRLGKRWSTLPRGIYFAAMLGVVHYYWLVKADTRLPLLLGMCLLVLLGLRAPALARKRSVSRPSSWEYPGATEHSLLSLRKTQAGCPSVAHRV